MGYIYFFIGMDKKIWPNGAGSNSIGILIACLTAAFPILKQQFSIKLFIDV